MGWFRKKDRVIDLAEHYRKKQAEKEQAEKTESLGHDTSTSSQTNDSGGAFGFLGGLASSVSANTPSSETSESEPAYTSSHEKKRKLAKRLMEMTQRIEDLSSQIYRLQQRIEVMERKTGVGY